MSMTKPPCHDGIDDCQRRYVGCHAECEKWHEWLSIHEEEKAREKQAKYSENDVNEFLRRQGERTRAKNQAQYQARYRRREK